MQTIHPGLLFGLAAVAIPIIIHLLNRRTAKMLDWGAMQFLMDSVEARRRRVQLEEALLLAARCLLLGLVAFCVARPFVPAGSSFAWVVIIPAFLGALVAITTAIILRSDRKWFWILLLTGIALLLFSVIAMVFGKSWGLKKLGTSGRKDIALIIDASTSMQMRAEGGTNFEKAILEAKEIIEKSDGGNSFSIIVGGPTPSARVPQPRVNKNDLLPVLDTIKPVRGKMDAFNALAAAIFSLGQGSNPNKEVIFLSDGQAVGWSMDNSARWDALKQGAKEGLGSTFKGDLRILFRKFPMPATFRNNSLADIKLSREVVGTDREVGIEITVENTGTEAVTPAANKPAIELTIGDKVLKDNTLGQLQPGQKQTVRFPHKFSAPGSYAITAKVNVVDELPDDDAAELVVNVVNKLNVLIVEGNPTGKLYERAATFTSLALAPVDLATLAASPAPVTPTPPPPADPNKPEKKGRQDVVVDPVVLPVGRISTVTSFQEYDVVILADVPKLPDAAAKRLASWVQSGGGLLVTPSDKAVPEFYNNWTTSTGDSLMPGKFGMRVIVPNDKDPIGVAMNTMTHQALRSSGDPKVSDLESTIFNMYWKMTLAPGNRDGSFVAGAMVNGDPFILSKKAGFGNVFLSACGFDVASTNLVTRQAFLPMIHQMVYFLSNPNGQPLQKQPAQSVTIPLSSAASEGGLTAEYFNGTKFQGTPFLIRIEPQAKLTFAAAPIGEGLPGDDFSVRLTGTLTPKFTEEYDFIASADDACTLWIDDKMLFPTAASGTAKIKLEAGRSVPIKIEMYESKDSASLDVSWKSASQKQETIPTDSLTPFISGSADVETLVGSMALAAPDGSPRKANLFFTRSGLVAKVQGDIVPGIYRLQVPKEGQKVYQNLLASDGTIPFSVAGDYTESKMTPLTKDDWTFFRRYFDVAEPKSAAQVQDLLAGRESGEELWKYLALGALFFLLAETALTRWIAISRNSGEEVAVDFENRFQAPKEFQEQLENLRKSA